MAWTEREQESAEPDVAALVQEFAALLYRVAFSVLRHAAEAEDAVQETFVRVLEARGRISEVRDMRSWLVRIVWNCALDRKRRITPAQMDEAAIEALVSRDFPADEVFAQAKELTDVLHALDRLPKKEREVLLLTAVEELTTAEIAAVVGRSESSVRSLVYRARSRLQERLENAAKKGGRK